MIFAALDPWVGLGAVATAFGSFMGGWAALRARATEKKSASREETQQALDAQTALLDRYEKRIAYLEGQNEKLHAKVNDVLARNAMQSEAHKDCERRLALAEARISELGG